MLGRLCLGAWLVGSFALAATAADRDGVALGFDGTDDWVEVADPVNATGPVTLEAWIRADEASSGRILSNRTAADGYELDVQGGLLRFAINGTAVGTADLSAWLGEWVHVAASWEGPSGGEIVMYVDGTAVATSTSTVTMNSAVGNLRIGCAAWNFYFFAGAIDEPRVFAAVVAPDDLRTWRNRRIAPDHPDYADLQGAWSFEEGSGQVASCAVNSPGRDGRLGSAADADTNDPVWVSSGMVAARASTWTAVKSLFRR